MTMCPAFASAIEIVLPEIGPEALRLGLVLDRPVISIGPKFSRRLATAHDPKRLIDQDGLSSLIEYGIAGAHQASRRIGGLTGLDHLAVHVNRVFNHDRVLYL